MHLKRIGIVLVMAALLAPSAARAEVLLTPFAGINFGGDADKSGAFGASIGWMGAGIFGVEGEVSYSPSFFDTSNFAFVDSDNVVSVMGNLIVGIPAGGTSGAGVKPYATIGLGILRSNVNTVGNVFDPIRNTDFGLNAGVGVMGFFNDHVGLRGDVRYFRSLTDPEEDFEFDVGLGDFDFWRGSLGLVFRF